MYCVEMGIHKGIPSAERELLAVSPEPFLSCFCQQLHFCRVLSLTPCSSCVLYDRNFFTNVNSVLVCKKDFREQTLLGSPFNPQPKKCLWNSEMLFVQLL